MLNREKVFIEFGKTNRWRLRRDENRYPIAMTRSRKNPHDHMYEGFDNDFGVAIRRLTKRKFTAVKAKLERMGCRIWQNGSIEGNFRVKIGQEAIDVARFLKIEKTNHKGDYDRFGFQKKLST